MIKSIYSSGRYMQVSGGAPPSPSIYNNGYTNAMNAQSFTGQMRYNPANSCIEIFDGNSWQMLATNSAQIGLSQEAEALLDWAREKRQEEVNLKMRMEQHPGLKDAYEKFKIMDILTQEEEKTNVRSQP